MRKALALSIVLAAAVVCRGEQAASKSRNDCDPRVRPAYKDAHPYAQSGDRCEGRYEPIAVRGPVLRIDSVGFVPDPPAGSKGSDPVLTFARTSSNVDIQVRSLSGAPYRMDTHGQPGAKGTYIWPGKILGDLRVPAESLGVLVQTSTEPKYYVPAAIAPAARPTRQVEIKVSSQRTSYAPRSALRQLKPDGSAIRLREFSLDKAGDEGDVSLWRTRFLLPSAGQFELRVGTDSALLVRFMVQ